MGWWPPAAGNASPKAVWEVIVSKIWGRRVVESLDCPRWNQATCKEVGSGAVPHVVSNTHLLLSDPARPSTSSVSCSDRTWLLLLCSYCQKKLPTLWWGGPGGAVLHVPGWDAPGPIGSCSFPLLPDLLEYRPSLVPFLPWLSWYHLCVFRRHPCALPSTPPCFHCLCVSFLPLTLSSVSLLSLVSCLLCLIPYAGAWRALVFSGRRP